MRTDGQISKMLQVRRSDQTSPATTTQPLATPQYNCHKSSADRKPNADFVKTIAESFCNDEKVEYGVLKPGESVEVKLEDAATELIHSVSISWLPGCVLKSQICDSGRENDGCKHWINEVLNECW
ncbi:hypothetical protein FLAG1_09463 [Fusarium langsethiae]|uniref:Uncharacterized protein n=2 Tax=Fusarium sambucinum species complex TaxID=569360 RepID=A0A0M9EQA5_FUSLA|nr:hypothetical protein FLAG1_09463 [Fusarium langsethiae]